MRNINYQINDIVRVIPDNYFNISKSGLLYTECFDEATGKNDKYVMLGGEYIILDIQDRFAQLLANNENNIGMKSFDSIQKSELFQSCSFKVGAKIRFQPQCSDEEISYLKTPIGNEFENENKTYFVSSILNDYYIFITDELGLGNKKSFPYRWIDFAEI
jgi:hypothetical protein